MDYKSVVDAFSSMVCIVSVEKNLTGNKRAFRIVTGNDAYIRSIEHPDPNMRMFRDKFVPDLEYTDYMMRDLNFEDYCYRSAVEKKSCILMHFRRAGRYGSICLFCRLSRTMRNSDTVSIQWNSVPRQMPKRCQIFRETLHHPFWLPVSGFAGPTIFVQP